MASSFLPAAAWPRVLPFAVFLAVLAARGALPEQAAGLGHWTLAESLYALQAGVAALALALYWPRYTELHGPSRRLSASAWLASIATGVIVVVLWVNLDAPWMRIGEPVAGFVPVDPAGRLDWLQIAVRTAGAVLVVPLMEELFWRSFVMRSVDSRDFEQRAPASTTALAIVLSSVVFALGHDLWLAGIIAGVAYALLYVRTGNLWCAVISHAVTNFLLAAWVVHGGHWQFW